MEELSKVIIFQLKEQSYGVDIQQVRSIERLQQITEVPGTPSFIKGVMHLRGETTPVIDLKERLDFDKTEDQNYQATTRILLVHVDTVQVGLIVDAATDVIDINTKAIESAPKIIGSIHEAFLKGVAKLENELLILLDLECILNFEEANEIREIVAG